MSTFTAESLLVLIKQLPSTERTRLKQMLAQPDEEQPVVKAPLDKRVPAIPMPDLRQEWNWIEQHQNEYAGQWVALDGDRLIAASSVQQEVWDAIKTDQAKLPFVHRIPAPDDLPYIGI
jgi:hypothetical protein